MPSRARTPKAPRTRSTPRKEPPATRGREEPRADHLELLVEATKVLNSTLELEKLCDVILHMATEHTDADRGSLFLYEPGGTELCSLLALGLEPRKLRVPEGQGVVGWVARNGQSVNLADARADDRFNPQFDELLKYRTRTLLAVPIKDRTGGILGVLELLNKRDGPFDEGDVGFLESISVHAAIALQNARSHQEALAHQRVERDLALARTIHEGLLPQRPPQMAGLEIGVRHEISFFVSGDYYDFLPAGDGDQFFVIADVEGKGAASALVVSSLQATLRVLVKQVHSLEGIMYHLNESMWENTRGEKYATVFLGLLDVSRRGLHYINAGHVPPVLIRGEDEIPLERGGTVIGLFPSQRYVRGFATLEPGDVVVACTDGITEAADAEGKEYGRARLVSATRAHRELAAGALVDALLGDVRRFASGGEAADDRVIMTVKAT